MTKAFILPLPVSSLPPIFSFCFNNFSQVDERLLDVSMSTLLDQTLPIELFNNNNDVDDDDSRSIFPTTTKVDDIDTARQRILVLEAELEESKKAATESFQELSKEKVRCSELENRIEELELELELERKKKKKVHENDSTELDVKSELEIAKKERDVALELVRDIRKLMV